MAECTTRSAPRACAWAGVQRHVKLCGTAGHLPCRQANEGTCACTRLSRAPQLTSGCVLTGVAKVESMATMAPCTGATHVSTVSARALRMCTQLLQCRSAASLCRAVPGDGLVSGPLWCRLCCCPTSCPAHLLVAQLCDARHIHTPHVCRQAGGAAGRCLVTPAEHNNSVGRMRFGSPQQHSFAAPAAAPCLQLTRVCRIFAEEQRHLRAANRI